MRVGETVEYRPIEVTPLLCKVKGYGHDVLGPFVKLESLMTDHPTWPLGQALNISTGADIRKP